MRIILTMLALALFGAAMPASAQPAPATKADVTILISIDGFRADYIERGLTPNLAALSKAGASAAMRPSFPTKTFPNHYTIVTGLRPDHHGIVGNSMIDPARPGQMFSLGDTRQSLDPFWWDEAEPIWVTAEKAGVRSATMFWPGSEVAIHQDRPEDWQRFDQAVSGVQRVNTVLDWLRRPAAIRPRFVTLYFDTVDMAGHVSGPTSEELNATLVDVDTRIGDLVSGIKALGLTADFIIVADHGMHATDESRVIQLDDLIDRASYIPVETGPYAAIEPVTGTDNRVFDALIKPHDHMDCKRKQDLPERLHYGSNPRVAAIICIAEPGWTILSGEPRYPVTGGAHGYDNLDPEMLAIFIASGPDIRAGKTLPVFDNVDVYPILARLIGIQPLASDGNPATLAPILAE